MNDMVTSYGTDDPYELNPLSRAILRREVFTDDSSDLIFACEAESPECGGFTPLHLAAFFGDETTAALLIKSGADVNAQDVRGDTPLHRAAHANSLSVTQLLLMHPSINAQLTNQHGQNALHIAVEWGATAVVSALCESPLFDSLDSVDLDGFTPVILAVLNNRPQIAAILIAYGANLLHRDNRGWSVIHWAAYAALDEWDIFGTPSDEELHELVAVSKDGQHPLHVAALYGRIAAAVALIDRFSCDVNCRDSSGATPLLLACETGTARIAQHLLKRGADVNAAARDGRTPLHAAVQAQKPKLVDMLLHLGANQQARWRPEGCEDADFTPLHLAALEENGMDVLNSLLDNEPNATVLLNLRTSIHGRTPLLLAVLSPNPSDQVVLKLSSHVAEDQLGTTTTTKQHTSSSGPNCSGPDAHGMTALHLAAYSGSPATFDYLLRVNRNDACVEDKRGRTPAFLAVQNSQRDSDDVIAILKTLISASLLDLTRSLDSRGRSILHVAAARAPIDAVTWLLQENEEAWRSPDWSATDSDGRTPLHYAAARENDAYDVTNLLLRMWPSWCRLVDNRNRLPCFYASHAANSPVVDLLASQVIRRRTAPTSTTTTTTTSLQTENGHIEASFRPDHQRQSV